MLNKIGYATMADSIVAASFQNILPGSYDRNSSSIRTDTDTDLEAQPELPGLPTFKNGTIMMVLMEENIGSRKSVKILASKLMT